MQTKPIELNPVATANLLRNITVDPVTGCWHRLIHMQGTDPHKYPAITWRIDGKRIQVRAARYAYTLHIGPIPEGLTIDHTCNHKTCVNPAHLEAVTQAENNKRKGERTLTCKNGHTRTADNVNRQGNCITCHRAYMKEYRASRR